MPGDLYFSNVSSLFQFESDLKDLAEHAFTNSGVTLSGSVSKFSTSSAFFNETFLSCNDPDFALGLRPFTIEGWFYLSSHGDRCLFGYGSGNANGLAVLADAAPAKRVYFGGSVIINVAGAFQQGTWTHIALTRDDTGTIRLFENGILVGSTQTICNVTSTDFRVGSGVYNNLYGYIDEFRTTLGIARYVDNFTVLSEPFPTTYDIMPYDPYWDNVKSLIKGNGVDGSSAIVDSTGRPLTVRTGATIEAEQSKFGGSSVYINGSTAGVHTSSSSDFDFGVEDFTIEAWIRVPTSISHNVTLFGVRADGTNVNGSVTLWTYNNSITTAGFDIYASDGTRYQHWAPSSPTLTNVLPNIWYHFAAVRSGNSLFTFVNGKLATTDNVAGKSFGSSSCGAFIGANPFNGSYGTPAYIDDFRVTRGVARYTSDFILLKTFPDLSSFSVPNAPTDVIASNPDEDKVTVSFNPPSWNGGRTITNYIVTSSPGNISASGTSSPIIVAGLEPNTEYSFTVKAINLIGESASSNPSNLLVTDRVPGAPINVTAFNPTYTSVEVSFDPPIDNGGDEVIDYQVTSIPGSVTSIGSTSPITVNGLTADTSYTFTVSARNGVGIGEASIECLPISTLGVASAPTNVNVTNVDITSATVSFDPSSSGDPTSYKVISSPGNVVAVGTTSPIIVTGLSENTTYTFSVIAINPAGESSSSVSSIAVTTLPATVPDTPTNVTVVSIGKNQATISFDTPDSNGSDIVQYIVTSYPGEISASGTISPITVPGLTHSTQYTFTVKAVNAVGPSAESVSTDPAFTSTYPTAPINVIASNPGTSQATVSFTSGGDGGDPITSYTVVSTPGNHTVTGSSSPLVVTGLDLGVTYTFKVKATNSIGDSLYSLSSNEVEAAPSNIAFTKLGDNSFKLVVPANAPLQDVLDGIVAAINDFGWEVWDRQSNVYRAPNLDGSYKYLRIVTQGTSNVIGLTEAWESWDKINHVGTNRAGPDITTVEAPLKTGFYLNHSSYQTVIYGYINPRWFMISSSVNGGPMGSVVANITGSNYYHAPTVYMVPKLITYSGIGGVLEIEDQIPIGQSLGTPFMWTHTAWAVTTGSSIYSAETNYIDALSKFEVTRDNVIGKCPRHPDGTVNADVKFASTSIYKIDQARVNTADFPSNIWNGMDYVFDITAVSNSKPLGIIHGLKVFKVLTSKPASNTIKGIKCDSSYFCDHKNGLTKDFVYLDTSVSLSSDYYTWDPYSILNCGGNIGGVRSWTAGNYGPCDENWCTAYNKCYVIWHEYWYTTGYKWVYHGTNSWNYTPSFYLPK